MIKNKTEEFRQRYSNKKSNISLPKQLLKTGFSVSLKKDCDSMQSTQDYFRPIRGSSLAQSKCRMAKVESTTLFKHAKAASSSKGLFNSKQLNSSLSKKQNFTLSNKSNNLQLLLKAKGQELKICQNDISLCRFGVGKHQAAQRQRDIDSQNVELSDTEDVSQRHVPSLKKVLFIKQTLSSEQFFSKLTPRNLFFCCSCFKYVFAVEKNMHFPDCQGYSNQISRIISDSQKWKFGWEKVQKIKQLSQYTNYRDEKIEELMSLIKEGELSEKYHIQLSSECQFLDFEQIIEAAAYVYAKLLHHLKPPAKDFLGINFLGCFT